MQSPNILVIPAYVLVIDDDSDRLKALRDRLQGAFREHDEVLALGSGEWLDTNRELMQRVPVQTVLVGRWSGWEQERVRQALADSYPDIPFYFIDGEGEPGRDGAPVMDFAATNPINARIRRILRDIGADEGGMPAASPQSGDRPDWLFRGLSGASPAIQSVRNDITLVAASDSTVLISGAAGSGKEIAARNIHFQSPRRLKPFVPVDCGAAAPDQLERDLFGHDPGSSDGDPGDGRGRFELADGGTLFLDDVGTMPLSMQFKLLRVLRERTFERVDGGTPRQVNVRIVAATHHDLGRLVVEGRFREDLYDCLNGFPIHMPDLKDRIEDLPVLVSEVQRKLQAGAGLAFSDAALDAMGRYGWPGNLRELSELVERMCAGRTGGEIGIDDLPPGFRSEAVAGRPVSAANPEPQPAAHSNPAGLDLERYMADVERSLIRQALEESGGMPAKAAERLNLDQDALAQKMRKHGF